MTETDTAEEITRPATARPRLGFAGVGWIGRSRMEAIAQSGFAEIAALTDPSAVALKASSGTAKAISCTSNPAADAMPQLSPYPMPTATATRAPS